MRRLSAGLSGGLSGGVSGWVIRGLSGGLSRKIEESMPRCSRSSLGRLRVPAVVAAAAVVHRQTWSVVADFALLNFRWVIRGLSVGYPCFGQSSWECFLSVWLRRLSVVIRRGYPYNPEGTHPEGAHPEGSPGQKPSVLAYPGLSRSCVPAVLAYPGLSRFCF